MARGRARPGVASARTLLDSLDRLKGQYREGVAAEKRRLLAALDRAVLRSAKDVLRLHEAACFLRAYPDDAEVLTAAEGLLARLPKRRDLRRFRRALESSGIAGTDIRFGFFAATAERLARRYGTQLTIDWAAFKNRDRLDTYLPLFVHGAEAPAVDECALSPREWLRRLKGPAETDAVFLIRRFETLVKDEALRERLYDELDPRLWLRASAETPSRTHARHVPSRVFFQARPLQRERPDLRNELARPPLAIRAAPEDEARRLVEMAQDAMLTRQRDLDVFAYGDARDVRLVDCGEGLQFACIGALPERRLLLESVYGFLTLKNGVPIGYVLTSALFGSSEIAYNVFDTFRGGEAALVYGRVLATTRALFGSTAFTVYPYQLGGDGNDEGLKSGAFWFYRKLGFEPRDAAARALADRELRRMRRDPEHRSDLATLRKLSAHNVYWQPGRRFRQDVIGLVDLPNVGLRASEYLSRRFGSDRERARSVCLEEAAALLGHPPGGLPEDERKALERWAPLVLILPGIDTWSRSDRQALASVVRAKGSRRESAFVWLFDGHQHLRRAILELATEGTGA